MADKSRQTLRDEASSLIGQYLLQGYRMLAQHCGDCSTVLVQKQKDKPLCVLCDELLPQTTTRPSSNDEEEPDIDSTTCIKETPPTLHPINPPHVKDNTRDIDYVREVLFKQMRTAAHQLELSQSVEHSSHLCRLIRDYADTIKTLKDI